MKLKTVSIICMIIVLCAFLVTGAVEKNKDYEALATACLEDVKKTILGLNESGFNTQRVNDVLTEGENYLSIQIILKNQSRPHNFSKTLSYCEEITIIEEKAFEAQDNFKALQAFYDDSLTQEMDTREIDSLILEIGKEISDERYENVPNLIDTAYEEIINTKSEYTTLNLVLTSTETGIKSFLKKHYPTIIIIFALITLFWLLFRKKFHKSMLNRKLRKLELRKSVLKDLIIKSQKEYFNKGTMSESTYQIKTEKFGELIRDLNRKISVTNEEIFKLTKSSKKWGRKR